MNNESIYVGDWVCLSLEYTDQANGFKVLEQWYRVVDVMPGLVEICDDDQGFEWVGYRRIKIALPNAVMEERIRRTGNETLAQKFDRISASAATDSSVEGAMRDSELSSEGSHT